jgi:hypothetical protein
MGTDGPTPSGRGQSPGSSAGQVSPLFDKKIVGYAALRISAALSSIVSASSRLSLSRIDRGLHVVVDAALAGAAQEGERLVIGVEHHLLATARISPDVEHPAVAEPQMRHLHCRRHPDQRVAISAAISSRARRPSGRAYLIYSISKN